MLFQGHVSHTKSPQTHPFTGPIHTGGNKAQQYIRSVLREEGKARPSKRARGKRTREIPPSSPRRLRAAAGEFPRRRGVDFESHSARSPTSDEMGLGLWTLLEGFLLLANALAILNEDRFLIPRGWSMLEVSGNGQSKSLKGQIVGLIYATQFLRMPLIALNVLVITVKLVSG
uniref:Yos1-like protein n=1 Tax=Leersia perrieri TaxID=77586 RepID=A0A0D9VTM6_9ORYZ